MDSRCRSVSAMGRPSEVGYSTTRFLVSDAAAMSMHLRELSIRSKRPFVLILHALYANLLRIANPSAVGQLEFAFPRRAMEPFFFWLVIAGLIALAVYVIRSPWNFRIRVRDGVVDVEGPAMRGKRDQIVEFFQQDMPNVRRAKVQGLWQRKRLQLRFGGSLSPGERQRIRNFLLMIL